MFFLFLLFAGTFSRLERNNKNKMLPSGIFYLTACFFAKKQVKGAFM